MEVLAFFQWKKVIHHQIFSSFLNGNSFWVYLTSVVEVKCNSQMDILLFNLLHRVSIIIFAKFPYFTIILPGAICKINHLHSVFTSESKPLWIYPKKSLLLTLLTSRKVIKCTIRSTNHYAKLFSHIILFILHRQLYEFKIQFISNFQVGSKRKSEFWSNHQHGTTTAYTYICNFTFFQCSCLHFYMNTLQWQLQRVCSTQIILYRPPNMSATHFTTVGKKPRQPLL